MAKVDSQLLFRGWRWQQYIRRAWVSQRDSMPSITSQARYWLLTIPHADFLPYLPNGVNYIKGQLERGENTGYTHWQVLINTKRKLRLAGVKAIFGNTVHAEPTRSEAANDYVWKEDTSIPNTKFELGALPRNRGDSKDWDAIKEAATSGRLDSIPSDVYIRNYNALQRIAADNAQPLAIERKVIVYWGPTGSGKSRRAWQEAGIDAYPKDPRSKFWDGYRDHENIVIDEFRGDIDISHVLRWFDRYPVIVEVKGGSRVLKAKNIWITSNLHPDLWYPGLDPLTKDALKRRLEIIEINNNDNLLNLLLNRE